MSLGGRRSAGLGFFLVISGTGGVGVDGAASDFLFPVRGIGGVGEECAFLVCFGAAGRVADSFTETESDVWILGSRGAEFDFLRRKGIPLSLRI